MSMRISSLAKGLPLEWFQGNPETEVSGVTADSRQAGNGTVFVAVRGGSVDGHQFIDQAIAQGARVIVAETLPSVLQEGVTYLRSQNSRRDWALLSANQYGRPATELVLAGVTGTNGKTTTATLLYKLFQALEYSSGLVSTISYQVGKETLPSTHTTPDPGALQKLFAQMRDSGCSHCFMEVSSHALDQERVAGIPFRLAMFTNITHDHLDYHGTFKAYIAAKQKLFNELSPQAVALTNLDDRNGRIMVQNTRAKVKTYSLQRTADYRARVIENTFEGLRLDVEGEEVWFRLPGSFNAYNLLMVYAAAVELGVDKYEALRVLSGLEGAEGRFQTFYGAQGKTAIVDYAHTPDALANVLSTIHDINRSAGAQVITVVGCGGNRDRTKRPEMGKIAATSSDMAIFTSDNPRNEDPQAILAEMMTGVEPELRKKVLVIENRREAIRTALRLAQPNAIVLVAGKGHETYQEIQGVKHPFDDREIIREELEETKSRN